MRFSGLKKYLLGVFLLLLSGPVQAANVCVLRGLDFSIYDEVLESFWKTMGTGSSSCNEVLKDREAQVTKRFSAEQPKLILALGNSAVAYVQKSFPKTPMVFGMVTDIANSPSLSGVTMDIPFEEQIRVAKSVIPGLQRIGLIYSVNNQKMFDQFKQSAQSQGLTLNSHAINNSNEAVGVISNFQGDDLMWLLPDQGVITNKNRDELIKQAMQYNLKTYVFSPTYLKGEYGADMSVSLDWKYHGVQIANLAKKILANPAGNYTIEKPTRVRLYLKKGRLGFNTNISDIEIIP